MTLVDVPGAPPGPGLLAGEAGRPGSAAEPPPGRRPAGLGAVLRQTAGTALVILATSLLGFGMWLAFGSAMSYARAQHDAYATFRVSLAQGTAPVGPTQPGSPNRLLAPGTPVAVLNIPDIRLNAVVFEGTSGQVLEDGPGHLRFTPMPGQAGISVIFGRRSAYGGPFSRLAALNPGAIITVTMGQGVAHYRVLDVRRAGEPAPATPAAGHGQLILTTTDGAPFAPSGVLRVDASLTSRPFPAPAAVPPAASLAPDEEVMGTYSLAWVPVVLWGQCLLVAAAALTWLGRRWGRWQTWIVAVPVLAYLTVVIADQLTLLLPNLI